MSQNGNKYKKYSKILAGLGLTYSQLGNYSKGEAYLQKALKYEDKNEKYDQAKFEIYHALKEVYTSIRAYDKALDMATRISQILKNEYGSKVNLYGSALRDIGWLSCVMGKCEQGRKLITQSLRIQKNYNKKIQ